MVLNRFVSRSTDKCLPFFNVLCSCKEFIWIKECERAFQELKVYIGHTLILAKPLVGEKIFTYIVVLEHAVSLVLVKEIVVVQAPV